MERLLSVRDACERLGIHPNTLRRWDLEGKIKVVRPPGGKRRVPESEINRILGLAQSHDKSNREQGTLESFLSFVFSRCREDSTLVKKAIMLRDGHKCTNCGETKNLVVYPPTLQGCPDDLKTLCKKCASILETDLKENIEVEKEKEEKNEDISQKNISRMVLIEEIDPPSLLHRTAFGDLISAAASLQRFTVNELSMRGRCPTALTQLFCDRLLERGYLRKTDEGKYELIVKVIV